MLLGCIADDLTGATDLALMLTRGGMRTVQVMGVPEPGADFSGMDAVVVALKSRTNPAAEAVRWSLECADALIAQGAQQLFFKYCSTFDSTERGNIGPVAAALLEHSGAALTIATPAFPAAGRTVYMGHLFVNGVPLHESPMRDHPLTPMRDANLVRVLQTQTKLKVGLVDFAVVNRGADAIAGAFAAATGSGQRIVIVDALTDQHLMELGQAARDLKLITGGSGAAIGLPRNFEAQGVLKPIAPTTRMRAPKGRAAIIAGSCSQATRGQVQAAIDAGFPAFRIDPVKLSTGAQGPADAIDWARRQPAGKPFLIYSSDDPDAIRRVQSELGRDEAGALVEQTLAAIAKAIVADTEKLGVTRLIVAGGETSGAVIAALGVTALEIGPEIAPGVPWTRSLTGARLVLALKSGNFGAADFFIKAWDRLQDTPSSEEIAND